MGVSTVLVARVVIASEAPQTQRAAQIRQPKRLATHINQIWRMDFATDNLFDGRKLRMLTVVDCLTREGLDIRVEQSLKGGRARIEHDRQ